MLTLLALLFVLHVMALGGVIGRRMNVLKLQGMAWVFAYLVLFYIGWGLLFALLPQWIVPELVTLTRR
jgi:hypothetical protein